MSVHTFESFELFHHLPAEALAGLPFAVAEKMDLDFVEWGGIHGEISAKRLADAGIEDLSQWEVIGGKLIDHSGWCDFEQKMEFHYEDLRILVRKTHLAEAQRAFCDGPALTHNPFAAALSNLRED
jgi:hypothetical protein